MKKVLSVLFAVVLVAHVLTGCGLTVPRPEIKEGEFNFSVTYEFNGETKTVSGIYACKYAGISWALDGGAHRSWEGYIKGEIEDRTVIGTTENGDTIELVLALIPEYFMDDFVEGYHEIPAPYISITVIDDEGMGAILDPDEVEECCGARIISYEYDEPIENSFAISN